MTMKNSVFFRPAMVTAFLLLIPLLGNWLVEGWNWPWTAFIFFGVVFLTAGVVYEKWGIHRKKGVLIGFLVGELAAAGTLAGLRYLNPEEDVAGIVILSFLLFGCLFAIAGFWMHYTKEKRGGRN